MKSVFVVLLVFGYCLAQSFQKEENGFHFTFTLEGDHISILALHRSTRRYTGRFNGMDYSSLKMVPGEHGKLTAQNLFQLFKDGTLMLDITAKHHDWTRNYQGSVVPVYPSEPRDNNIEISISGNLRSSSFSSKGASGGGTNSVRGVVVSLEEQPIPLTLSNGVPSEGQAPTFMLQGKLVVVEGVVNVNVAGAVAVLPEAFRPTRALSFPAVITNSDGFCRVDVNTDGTIVVSKMGHISLSGITFRIQ